MNKNILIALATAGLLSVTTGCTNVREIGQVNGLNLTRVTTRGVFSPSTTTVVVSDPNRPGTIEGPIANAQGPGFIPAVAQAAGTAGGAALLRPSRTNVEQNGGSASATGGNAAAVGGSGSTTQNGSVHHNTGNGNGSGNNGNH